MITNQNISSLMNAERKCYKSTEIYRGITAILLIGIIILLLVLPCHCSCSEQNNSSNHLPWDDNVTYDDDQKQANIEALNQKVADGMITISMNADPIFENGSAKGNLNIENDVSNTRPQVVEIYLKGSDGKADMNQLVYRSGKIPVGGKIQMVALDKKLPKGNYPAWVGFNAVSEDDSYIGTAGAEITLHILN